MSQNFTFYNQRAEESAAEAEAATLDQVRERALRSEKTWRGLAAQAKRVENDRVKAETARVEKRAAELADAEAAEATAEAALD